MTVFTEAGLVLAMVAMVAGEVDTVVDGEEAGTVADVDGRISTLQKVDNIFWCVIQILGKPKKTYDETVILKLLFCASTV